MVINTKAGASLYCPDSLNLEQVLRDNGKTSAYIRNHLDKYSYIIHRIIEYRIHDAYRINEVRTSGTYVSINLERLRERLNRRYAEAIVRDLLAWGIIETDNLYVDLGKQKWLAAQGITAALKSKGYRLTTPYVGKWSARPIVNKKFVQHLLKFQSMELTKAPTIHNITGRNLRPIRIHAYQAYAHIVTLGEQAHYFAEMHRESLNAQLGSKGYRASLKTYKSLVQALAERHNNKHVPEITGLPLLPKAKELTQALKSESRLGYTIFDYVDVAIGENRKKYEKMVEKIVIGDKPGGFFIKQPDLTSRVYTNITSLATELRQFLYHKSGRGLVNMDIRNSQPFFFVKLLKEYFREQDLPEDVQHYIELTSTGIFYDHIVQFLDPECVSRAEFKGKFFARIFFCEVEHTRKSKMAQAFAAGKDIIHEETGEITHYKGFPNVLRAIQHYKVALGSYEQLAIRMQRDEAAVMLGTVLRQLYKRRIWCTTIHDSVVCLHQDQLVVQAVLEDAFATEFGIIPTIKPEIIDLDTTQLVSTN